MPYISELTHEIDLTAYLDGITNEIMRPVCGNHAYRCYDALHEAKRSIQECVKQDDITMKYQDGSKRYNTHSRSFVHNK